MIIGKKNQGFGIYLGPHLYLFPFFKSMKMARKKVYWEFFIWDILNVRHYKPCTRGCLISTQCCKYQNRHSSKNIWVIKLTFCQNDPLIGESFWENTSLVTLILFEQCLFWYSAQSTYFWDTLYEVIVVVHIRISLFESKNFFCSWFFFYTLKPISYILPSTPYKTSFCKPQLCIWLKLH